MTTGVQGFVDAMVACGHRVDQRGGIVLVLVDVPVGPHAGTEVWVGGDPPGDFPTVPPHWVHLPDHIELANGGRQRSELGSGWSKWSRPHKQWQHGRNPAAQWLAHARALLAAAVR
jgi:hypothetical protein